MIGSFVLRVAAKLRILDLDLFFWLKDQEKEATHSAERLKLRRAANPNGNPLEYATRGGPYRRARTR